MEVYLVLHEVGDYEQREVDPFAIYDSFKQAYDFLLSVGFQGEEVEGELFVREHEFVIGKCSNHTDYAHIVKLEMNKVREEVAYHATHYKQGGNYDEK